MRLITIVLLASVALAGCGDPAGQGDAGAGSSEETSPTAGATEDLTVSPSPGAAGTRRLQGTVSTGVEAGCLLLTAPDGVYLLVGGDRGLLRAGETVVVTGVVDRHLVTTCQQGIPLVVSSVGPA